MQSSSFIKLSVMNTCCRYLESLLKSSVAIQNIVRGVKIQVIHSINFCYHQNI